MNDNKILLEQLYKPSSREIDAIVKVYEKYDKWKNYHNAVYEQFEGMSLRNYIEIARDKFNGVIPIDPTIDRKKFFSKEFRNTAEQVLTFIANLAQNPSFYGEEGLDGNMATFLNALLSLYRKGTKWKIIDALHFLQTIVDGTGIVYISWNPRKRKLKNITFIDPETGEVDFEEIEKEENAVDEIWVDPLDIFIPKVYEADIDKQGELIWRKTMTWTDFKLNYSSYPMAKYVYPGNQIDADSFFAKIFNKTILSSDKVEILQYYNRDEDEFILIANGVFLNPVKGSQRSSRISPLLWNHKELPFAKTIYRPTSPSLFWGVSLIHLVKDEVDAYNEIIEMALDRIYRAINPPVITNDFSVPNDTKLEAGKLYITRGQWQELQMGNLDPNVWNFYTTLQNQISRTSTPAIPPSVPSRQPKSAMENLIRQQKELQSHQLQKLFFQDLLEQKIWLFIQNILQFLTVDKAKRAAGKMFDKILFMDDIATPAGLSSLEVRIKDNISPPQKLKAESILKSLSMKKRVEIIEISVDALSNLNFDVGIKFDLENTPEIKKAMFLEFIKVIMGLFPQQLDTNKLIVRLFEVFNENPADYLPENIIFALYSGIKEKQNLQQVGEQNILSQPKEGNIQSDLIQTERGTAGVLGTGRSSLNDLIQFEGM